MRKETMIWTVKDLEEKHARINFPEYQREPSVWSRGAKQRLVDSMLRQFDIASLYVYDNEDGSFDCIDGRQRIGAIMSFLNKNLDDEDNGFSLKPQNEIYGEEDLPFADLEGIDHDEAVARARRGDSSAKRMIAEFAKYQLTVVRLSGSRRPEEFNLQFTRLNLGTIINSGEKLHAMVGAMRDTCFGERGLGQHAFLDGVRIPTRRYSKEQVAAQILAQAFSLKQTGGYTKTRHFDLQRFFKEYAILGEKEREWIGQVWRTMDGLASAFHDLSILRNRAITVSTVLLALRLDATTRKKASALATFMSEFLCRLKWQVGKGLDVAPEYRYLMDFQRHVTQASVEKPAVEERARVLEKEHALWLAKGRLAGDSAYQTRTRRKPSEECRRQQLAENDVVS